MVAVLRNLSLAVAARSLAAPLALGILFLYGLLNNAYVLSQFIKSDSLLPAQLVWDLAHHGYAWRGFQFPRVLRLMPDLLFFTAIQLFGIGWRWGMALLATTIASLGLPAAATKQDRILSTFEILKLRHYQVFCFFFSKKMLLSFLQPTRVRVGALA